MKMNTDYLVVGMGISGVSIAKLLGEKDYILIEKEKEYGGYCKTTICGDYIWDYAGHFYHFRTERMRREFLNCFSEDEYIYRPKTSKIYVEGRYIDYPFQANIHQLSKNSFIKCVADLIDADDTVETKTFKEMLISRYGKGICDLFLIPYNEKLYACDLDELDSNSMGRFFPAANKSAIAASMRNEQMQTYNAHYYYPKKGAFEFLKRQAQSLCNDKIMLQQELIGIDSERHIAYTTNHEIHYHSMISTIPYNLLCKVTKMPDEKIMSLSYNKVLVLNAGFDRPSRIKTVDWIYFPQKDLSFYRVGFYNNIQMTDKMSIYVEIGFMRKTVIDEDSMLGTIMQDLRKVGIVTDQIMLSYQFVEMDPAYIHIGSQTNTEVCKQRGNWEAHDIYTIGRYGEWSYMSMEDSMVEAEALVKRICDKNEE